MSTHTPGPWVAEEVAGADAAYWIVMTEWTKPTDDGQEGVGIANVYGGKATRANAHLIATAPDLLAAAEAALPYLDPTTLGAFDAMDNLRTAIAAAKGGGQ